MFKLLSPGFLSSALFTTLLTGALSAPGSCQTQATPSPLGRAVAGRYIVTYRSGVVPAAAPVHTRMIARHDHLGVSVLAASADAAATLAQDPSIATVVQDRMVTAHNVTVRAVSGPDSIYNSQQGWAVRAVGGYAGSAQAPGPWATTKGAGVRIAILDSGVDATHPDLAPNLALNLSEVDQTALPSACDDGSPQDQEGHGSWTASLAAAALGPNTGEVAGVAPEATLLNIKVLERMPASPTLADPTGCTYGQAAGLLSWVLQGINDAVANRADIVSMSLGTLVDITTGDGAGLKATFDHATQAAFDAGTILIAAAGNDGFDLSNQRYVELPAQARDVVAIIASTNAACAENLAAGSTCAAGPVTRPYYSNFGAPLDALAAPGGSYPAGPDADPTQATGWIRGACSMGKPSTLPGPPADANHSEACFGLGRVAYVQAMGTSASAPLAAGVAALIRAAHPGWNATAVVAALRGSAVSLPGLAAAQVSAVQALAPADVQSDPIQSLPVQIPLITLVSR